MLGPVEEAKMPTDLSIDDGALAGMADHNTMLLLVLEYLRQWSRVSWKGIRRLPVIHYDTVGSVVVEM